MVCQKCDLPSSLFNSAVNHRFLPPPSTRVGVEAAPFLEAFCLQRHGTVSGLERPHLHCSWAILAKAKSPSSVPLRVKMVTPPQRGSPGDALLLPPRSPKNTFRMNSLRPCEAARNLTGGRPGGCRLCLHADLPSHEDPPGITHSQKCRPHINPFSQEPSRV